MWRLGLWCKGNTPVSHAGDVGSIPSRSTARRGVSTARPFHAVDGVAVGASSALEALHHQGGAGVDPAGEQTGEEQPRGRAGLASRHWRVRFPSSPPSRGSSNGESTRLVRVRSRFDSGPWLHKRLWPNGQGTRLRTGRLGVQVLPGAPRLCSSTDRTRASEARDPGSTPGRGTKVPVAKRTRHRIPNPACAGSSPAGDAGRR